MPHPLHAGSRMADRDGLSDTAKGIIAAYLGLPKELVVEEAKLALDLGADSLEIADIVIALESAFDIEIDDSMHGLFKTVGDIVEHLHRLTEARQ